MLSSIDLFSGVGGITHALRGIATPTMYCEVDESRKQALATLMQKKLIPTAPIHPDVCALTPETAGTVDMIAGGWPCRGFSIIGKRTGFDHPQSALFVHLARLVRETRPRFVFQENVSNLLSGGGLDDIIEVFKDAGYDAWWVVMPAYAVGAPQIRKRWFCLGVRRDVADVTLQVEKYERHDWTKNEPPRMVYTPVKQKRLSMLGNSVVPDCVRLAFMLLFTGFSKTPEELWSATELKLQRPTPSGVPLPPPGGNRQCGVFMNGALESLASPMRVTRPHYGITLVPGAHATDIPLKANPEKLLTEPHTMAMWSTPRGSALGACNYLTQRGKGDLYTQLRFARDTPDSLRAGRANAEWVEHLMGFPPGWTEH